MRKSKQTSWTSLVGSSSLDVCSTLPPPPPVCDWVTWTREERLLNFKMIGSSPENTNSNLHHYFSQKTMKYVHLECVLEYIPASTSIIWGTNSDSGTFTGTVETECVRRMAMLMGPSPIGSPAWKGPNILLVSTSPSKDVLMPPEIIGSFDWYSFTWPRNCCVETTAVLARIVITS